MVSIYLTINYIVNTLLVIMAICVFLGAIYDIFKDTIISIKDLFKNLFNKLFKKW